MTDIREITSTEDPEFQEALQIYEAVFPPEQRVDAAYFLSSMTGAGESPDPHEQRYFLVSRRDKKVSGMATYTYHPDARLGFLCYLAADPQQGDPAIEETLYSEVLDRIERSDPAAVGCVVEMDPPHTTSDPAEADRRQSAIDDLMARGWILLDGIDYHMPPLREGETALSMQLMFRPLHGQLPDREGISNIVRNVYRDVYGLDGGHPLVRRALETADQKDGPTRT